MSDTPAITFRLATLADEPYLLPMFRALVEQEPNPGIFNEKQVRASLRNLLAHPEYGRIWIFLMNGNPAGYIILTFGFSFEYHGRDAFIDELYVLPEFRKRGIGKLAVQVAEREAAALGVNALHLEVDTGNDPALELYRRAGYEDHNRKLMTKWLNPQN